MATIPGTLNTNLTDEQVLEAFDNALTHTPSDSTPKEDGSGSAGEAETFARSDHEHPHDTTKQDTLAFEGTYNASTNKVATMSAVKDGKLAGYAQTSGNVAETDKIIEAIGKVEKKADDNKTNILTVADQSIKYNYSPVSSATISGSGFIIDTTNTDLPAGDYKFCWTGTATTQGTTINVYQADGTRIVNQLVSNAANMVVDVTIPQNAAKFNLYTTVANTISNLRIIPKSLYDAGFTDYQPYAMSNVELTANILNKQDKATASGERYNTTDTYARYITLTIPANRVCKVSAALSFSNSQPRGIAISQSSDSSTFDTTANLIGQKVETSTAVPQLIAEGYCSFSTDKTLYVWAKSASAASNSIFASVEYLS